VQIVGYDRRVDGEPAALRVASDGHVERTLLSPGDRLDLGLGSRHCAGSVAGETHRACSHPDAPYCSRHTSTWPCARCTGNCAMPVEDCHEEHAIYLAGFAPDIVKVGVTKHWRLATRLEEQGADRAVHVRTVENGRKARAIEAELATGITDRVRVPRKVPSLYRTFDDAAWDAALADFDVIERFDFDYDLALDRQPVRETVAIGDVVGTKGRLLVLAHRGTTYAVDMRDLVGHEVTENPAGSDLQSSLGAYQ